MKSIKSFFGGILILGGIVGLLTWAIPKPTPTRNRADLMVNHFVTPPCNANYSGCLSVDQGDYDCRGGNGSGPNFTGRVRVLGYDQYDLDGDGNGIGCE